MPLHLRISFFVALTWPNGRYALAQNLNLGDTDIHDLLLLHASEQGETYDTACNWIKANPDAWRSWVPDQTAPRGGLKPLRSHGNSIRLKQKSGVEWASKGLSQGLKLFFLPEVCSVGRGLVDLQGSFVWTREEAVNCEVCPPGRASLKEKTTRVCRPCEPGFFQPPSSRDRSSSCFWGSYRGFIELSTGFDGLKLIENTHLFIDFR